MIEISLLRIGAIIVGLLAIILAFLRLRKTAEERSDVWLTACVGTFLFLIGAFPKFLNIPSSLLSMGNFKGGRILTVLFLLTIFLWILVLRERFKRFKLSNQIDTIMVNLAVRDFFKKKKNPIREGLIFVLMPTFNEAENLEALLPQIPNCIEGKEVEVLVLDDGSSDNSSEVAEKLGVNVVSLSNNRGGGAALRVGYAIAIAVKAKVIVTMDSDGQHNPKEIPLLVEPIMSGDCEIVIGSRILGGFEKTSKLRAFGVILFSRIIRFLTGVPITDCSSGFRAISSSVFDKIILLRNQYHTPELIIDAAKRGFRIKERPIFISSRFSGKSKKGGDLYYGLKFIRTIIYTWLR